MLKPALYWCQTKEAAINLLNALKSQGVVWSSGMHISPITDNRWDRHMDQTCYRLSSGNELSYSSLEFYKNEFDFSHLDIITFDKTSIRYYLNIRGEKNV